MAEYYISYKELEEVVNQYITNIPNNDRLVEYKAEILSALTGDFEPNDAENVKETVALWKNQIEKTSQLLLGTKYISIQQTLLAFLKLALTSGLIDAVILYVTQGTLLGFTFAVGSNIAFTLWEWFTSVKNLDDFDFCIYMQAVTHFNEYKYFTIQDMKSWFPTEQNQICNMHNSTWDCDHLNIDNTCDIIKKEKINDALKSLYKKGLLDYITENDHYSFKFKK